MDFYDLDLDDATLDALDAMRFEKCSPIQEAAIPVILEGKDVIGVAQTGTGKTAAYLLPILNQLNKGTYSEDHVNCVIMAPTRELAQQIDKAMEGFSYFMNVSSVAIYGGNDGIRYEQEKRGLTKGADIVIATPGRLISHMSLGNVDFSKVSFLCLTRPTVCLTWALAMIFCRLKNVAQATADYIVFGYNARQNCESGQENHE